MCLFIDLSFQPCLCLILSINIFCYATYFDACKGGGWNSAELKQQGRQEWTEMLGVDVRSRGEYRENRLFLCLHQSVTCVTWARKKVARKVAKKVDKKVAKTIKKITFFAWHLWATVDFGFLLLITWWIMWLSLHVCTFCARIWLANRLRKTFCSLLSQFLRAFDPTGLVYTKTIILLRVGG